MIIIKLRDITNLSQSKFASFFGIPVKTLQNWELGTRKPPDYVINMMIKLLKSEGYNVDVLQ